MWPFVKEAVERGYVIICPDYRGSTGYGEAFHNEIDYGGKEIDDVMSAVDYLEDAAARRSASALGIMGWSHGGYITLFNGVSRQDPFKAGGGDRAGHEPRVPAVVQGTRISAQTSRRRSASRGCPSRSRISTSSDRRSTTSTS